MHSRRDVLALACAGCAAFAARPLLAFSSDPVPALSFERILAAAESEPAVLEAARGYREGLEQQFNAHSRTKSALPRRTPSVRQISDRAKQVLIVFEVSNRQLYDRRYRRPTWPGGGSGITIGIGYDIGYVDETWLEEDWATHASPPVRETLKSACGLRGTKARDRLAQFQSIDIPWESALKQFESVVLPLYTAETEAALSNTDKLSADSLGALVSLGYNRGPSYGGTSPNRAEMVRIAGHMKFGRFDRIPKEIRDMKRIWASDPSLKGLLTRRDAEAALFEMGLASGGRS
jgi:GH24 family phage-related lysozyme (muramidase)